MSRKSRQKKKNKQKILKKVDQISNEIVDESADLDVADNTPTKKKKMILETTDDEIIDDETKKFIRKDVRLIIYTLVGLAIILTVVKILQLKTGYISDLGNWLFQIFNINTG